MAWFTILCGKGWGMVNILGPFVTEGDAIRAGDVAISSHHRVIVFEGREVKYAAPAPEVARRIQL